MKKLFFFSFLFLINWILVGDFSNLKIFRQLELSKEVEKSYDLKVWAWGYNRYGQLGNGTFGLVTVPVQVLNLSNVIEIELGSFNSIALKNDGTVWAWGLNEYGQLGDGTNVNSKVPVQVLNLTDVVSIAGGWGHSLALRRDGTVWAWGYNFHNELGTGLLSDFNPFPLQVPEGCDKYLTGVIAIEGGGDHSLALKSNGTVWAWGFNYYGQKGDGLPSWGVNQVLNIDSVFAISAGANHSLAITYRSEHRRPF